MNQENMQKVGKWQASIVEAVNRLGPLVASEADENINIVIGFLQSADNDLWEIVDMLEEGIK